MSEMFLDAIELKSLTQRTQHAAQARMLRSMGIVFKVRPDGSLAVLRAHIEAEFGIAKKATPKTPAFEPNWSAMNSGKTSR